MRHNDNDRHTTALTLGMCHEKLVTSSPYDQVLVGVALIVFVIVLWSVVVVSDYYSEVIPGSVYPDTQTHALLRFIPDIITRSTAACSGIPVLHCGPPLIPSPQCRRISER